MQRADSFEKTLILGKIEGKKRGRIGFHQELSLCFVGGHSVPAVSSHGCPSVFVCPWFSSSSSIDEDSNPTKSESHSHGFF